MDTFLVTQKGLKTLAGEKINKVIKKEGFYSYSSEAVITEYWKQTQNIKIVESVYVHGSHLGNN